MKIRKKEWVPVGIDPSSVKMAVVILLPDGPPLVHEVKLSERSGPAACHAAIEVAHSISADLMSYWGLTPDVLIERQVLGGHIKSSLAQAQTSGALQGGFYAAGARIDTVQSSTWKKEVFGAGKGNAKKEEVARSLQLGWPSLYKAVAHSQDCIDAACIALCCQRRRS